MYCAMNKSLIPQFLASLPMMINFMLVHCCNSWMANAVYFLTRPNHEPSATVAQCGLMETCYQFGRFIFAIPSGIWVDKYGTKFIIISIGCIQVVTWVWLSVSSAVWVIFVARFLQGFASALSNTTGSNTIGELCSPKYRGTFIVIFKCFGTLGTIIECSLASVFASYRVNVYSTMALSLTFLFTSPWITETPYHLLGISKCEESKRVLAKLRRGHAENKISDEYESMKETIERVKSMKSQNNWFQNLAQRSTRRPLIFCVLMSALIFTNGNSVINLYASVIFPPNKYFSNSAYPLVLSLIQLVSSVCTVLLIDTLPRRHLLMLSGLVAFLTQSVNGIAYYQYSTSDDEAQKSMWRWILFAGTILFWVVGNAVMLSLNFIVRAELLPLSIRGLGNSLCMISQAISIILSYQVFNFVRTYYGMAPNYVVFAINSLLVTVVGYYFMPETRGKTLAEVENANHEKN